MNITFKCFALFCLLTTAVKASPLTDQTYLEFHEASKTKITLEKVLMKSDEDIQKVGLGMMQGRTFGTKELEALAKLKKRIRTLLESLMGYEVMVAQLKPMYMDNFTEEEVKEIIRFYKTPAGIAIVDKMPILADYMGTVIYTKVESIKPEAQKIFEDYAKEITVSATNNP